MVHRRIGDVVVDRGRTLPGGSSSVISSLRAARIAYQASLTIAERLAEVDPGNVEWQHGLAMALSRFLIGQGADHEALAVLERGLSVIRLKAQSPDNAMLQNELAGFEDLIGSLEK
jgi:hypothetical protein